MTRRSKGIAEVVPEELVEVSEQDAATIGINDRDWVFVSSRRGKVKVRAKATERSQQGNVFMTFHFQDALTNILTSGHRDPISGTPEYKACAVKVEKA